MTVFLKVKKFFLDKQFSSVYIVYRVYIQYNLIYLIKRVHGRNNMDILIQNTGDQPIYEQIATQIKHLILKGELAEGTPLPSMRLLAKELRISVITTKRAYEELEREGFITTATGKGSFVAKKNVALVREEYLRRIETLLGQSVAYAKEGNIPLGEVQELLTLLYEEN